MPLTILSKLLFASFEELEGETPKSLSLGDYARPKLVPTKLGKLLAELDLIEAYFHVEYYTDPEVPAKNWAEIWDIKEWHESNAKKHKSKTASATRVIQHDITKLHDAKRRKLIELIEDELATHPGFRAIPVARKQLAHSIANNYKKHNLNEVIKTLELFSIIEEFEKEQ